MRNIELNEKPLHNHLSVTVNDPPGNGGANHDYSITFPVHGASRSGMQEETRLRFQNGPINEVGVNGISDEALLAILIDRARGFRSGPFASREGSIACTKLEEAYLWLQERTRDRTSRGVEGYQRK